MLWKTASVPEFSPLFHFHVLYRMQTKDQIREANTNSTVLQKNTHGWYGMYFVSYCSTNYLLCSSMQSKLK